MTNMQKNKIAVLVAVLVVLLGTGGAAAYAKRKQVSLVPNAQAKKEVQNTKKIDAGNTVVADPSQQNPVADTTSQQLADVQVQTPPAVQTPTPSAQPSGTSQYPLHKNISTTYFWAGEEAGKANKNISNLPSAWDDDWTKHFGGIDDPNKRSGFVVASFTPKENSFYFALPYNDFDSNGKRKKDVGTVIPWANSKKWGSMESMCKNQWIKITKGGKTAYAQWEDVGPFGEDDSAYVFGNAAPKSKTNDHAGLDVSPAVKDMLGLGDVDKTDWQFVDANSVPDGPWKKTATTSQIYWN